MKFSPRFMNLLGALSLFTFASTAFGGAVCGPGTNWVNTCPGGIYSFHSVSNMMLSLDLDNNLGNGFEINSLFVQTIGTTYIYLAPGADHQMLSEGYSLTETEIGGGATIIAGDGIANGLNDGAYNSPGAITERGFSPSFCDPATRTADPFLADSCYQIFFQMTIPAASLVLHNATPLTVACTGLTGVPPDGCRYLWNEAYLNLYTSDNVLRGLMLPANAVHHEISPEPGTIWLLVGALVGLGSSRRRLRR